MFVLHEHGAGVDVDDADGVPAAGRHEGRRLLGVVGVGLEDDLPDLRLDVGRVVVLAVRADEVDRVVGQGLPVGGLVARGDLGLLARGAAARDLVRLPLVRHPDDGLDRVVVGAGNTAVGSLSWGSTPLLILLLEKKGHLC